MLVLVGIGLYALFGKFAIQPLRADAQGGGLPGVRTISHLQTTGTTALDAQRTPEVIDGDTLEIGGKRVRPRQARRVPRLLRRRAQKGDKVGRHGVDAPEADQTCENDTVGEYRCGQLATQTLRRLIDGRPVSCRQRDRDRYLRIVATCSVNERDLGGLMVRSGFAVADRRYSDAYVEAEERAKAAGEGIWGGHFISPWDWRGGTR